MRLAQTLTVLSVLMVVVSISVGAWVSLALASLGLLASTVSWWLAESERA
jgi:hypothetical protein